MATRRASRRDEHHHSQPSAISCPSNARLEPKRAFPLASLAPTARSAMSISCRPSRERQFPNTPEHAGERQLRHPTSLNIRSLASNDGEAYNRLSVPVATEATRFITLVASPFHKVTTSPFAPPHCSTSSHHHPERWRGVGSVTQNSTAWWAGSSRGESECFPTSAGKRALPA